MYSITILNINLNNYVDYIQNEISLNLLASFVAYNKNTILYEA